MRLSRRGFLDLGSAALAAAMLGAHAPAQAGRRPDVVLLVGHRDEEAPPPGRPLAATAPALARLAREGFSLDNCIGRYPFGGSCWAMLLGGRWPAGRFGAAEPGLRPGHAASGQASLGQAFAQAGYGTAYVGHWHLGPGATPTGHYGFDRWIPPPEEGGAGPEEAPWIAAALARLLAGRRPRPLLLIGAWGPSPGGRSSATAMGALDRSLAQMLRQLEDQGTLDQTIILCTELAGPPATARRGEAASRLPAASRVSLIARWPPGIRAGARSDHPVAPVDIMPTLCALAAVPVPAGCAGRDCSGVLAPAPGHNASALGAPPAPSRLPQEAMAAAQPSQPA